ncbi:MAG: phosphatase PAP2 family protein [Chloroflexi bacterium]|nr:phosphatase PAP2 family protein [Chloroflexota bacterium]
MNCPLPRHIAIFTLLCALGFVILTGLVVTGNYLPLEKDLLRFVIAHRVALMDPVLLLVSTLGSANFILPAWLLLMVVFLLRGGWMTLLRLLPIPLGYPLYALIKTLVARPGPTPPEFPRLHDLSIGYYVEGLLRQQLQQLPPQGVAVPVMGQPLTTKAVEQIMESGYVSGHALVAFIFYGTLSWLAWKSIQKPAARKFATVLLITLAFLVGLVRIYMGVHFPSDVLGAWLLGVVVLSATLGFAQILAQYSTRWRRTNQSRAHG